MWFALLVVSYSQLCAGEVARWVLQGVPGAVCKSAQPLSAPTHCAVWSARRYNSAAMLSPVPACQQGAPVLPVVWAFVQPKAHAVLWDSHSRQPI